MIPAPAPQVPPRPAGSRTALPDTVQPRVVPGLVPAPVAKPRRDAAPEAAAAPSTRRGLRARVLAWARPLAGALILGVLLWRVGSGAFVGGLAMIDGPAVAAALALGAVTTVCCAWRWSVIAAGLGVPLRLRTAVADCYRSVFLNATLPGGVLGDVHRAVSHGRGAGDVGRGIRAVVWERTAGQVVQLVLAAVLLLVLPSPVRAYLPAALGIGALACVAVAVAYRVRPRGRWASARWACGLRAARTDVRDGLFGNGNWARIVPASVIIVAGHLGTFLVAARTAGATAPLAVLAPLALLALLAMGVPANVGGFGPREGVAAWAFGAVGLTAAQGVATAVVYGALVLVSSLPGAAVLVVRRLRVPASVSPEGAVIG